MLKSEIETILRDQQDYLLHQDDYTPRTLQDDIRLDIPLAVIISGVRRSGKSTLLKQLYTTRRIDVGYLHFDDPRLNEFQILDFYKVEEIWSNKVAFQFDEIQKIDRWEEYVRQAIERKRFIGITGSNANLLSRELGTLLTGRTITHELFPFSYSEYISYRKIDASFSSFEMYLSEGGFPEAIKYKIKGYHNELFQSIVQRDIAIRFRIKNVNDLVNTALHLINNCARLFSYSKIARHYHIASVKTVSNYVNMLQEAYLLFTIPVFSYSYKKQVNNPKKIYVIDHAFGHANSTQLFDDFGRLLENIVFLNLRRKYTGIYYHKGENNTECDFIVSDKGAFIVVQVCWKIHQDNKEREVNGLLDALKTYQLTEGTIITADQEDHLTIDNYHIQIIPFWKWDTKN